MDFKVRLILGVATTLFLMAVDARAGWTPFRLGLQPWTNPFPEQNLAGVELAFWVAGSEVSTHTIGIQVAPAANLSNNPIGVSLAAVNFSNRAVGASLGILNWTIDSYGVQAGLLNSGRVHGIQAGLLNGQLSPKGRWYSASKPEFGLKAGLINGDNGGPMWGLNVGAITSEVDLRGLQIGLVNYANTVRGAQIGLLNITGSRKGIWRRVPIVNVGF